MTRRPAYLQFVMGDTGQVTVLMLLVMLLCFVLTGFVIDIANAYFSHKRLQNIADMSAIAVGDQASRDSTLRSDPQKLENLLREVISRNAQMNQMPLAAGDVQITTYQNDPEKLFDVSITKNTSPLLFKTLPFNLKASTMYGYTPGNDPIIILFIYDAQRSASTTAIRNSIKQIIHNVTKPEDYVGYLELDVSSLYLLRLLDRIDSTSEQQQIESSLVPQREVSDGDGHSAHFALNYGRFDFRRLKGTIPLEKWNKLQKIIVYYTLGTYKSLMGYTPGYDQAISSSTCLTPPQPLSVCRYVADYESSFNSGLYQTYLQGRYTGQDGITLYTANPPGNYNYGYVGANLAANAGGDSKQFILPGSQTELENAIKAKRSSIKHPGLVT